MKRRKRSDFWTEIPVSKENEALFADHLVALKQECSRPPHYQDVETIKQLMISTYEHRRAEILTIENTIPVKEIVMKYPPGFHFAGYFK